MTQFHSRGDRSFVVFCGYAGPDRQDFSVPLGE